MQAKATLSIFIKKHILNVLILLTTIDNLKEQKTSACFLCNQMCCELWIIYNSTSKQTVRAFHDWRKDAKYLRYHLELLRGTWPKELKRFAKEVDRLVDYLSDDHDLAMLRERVLEASQESGTEQETLIALIDKRRAELQARAYFLGERIYAENPEALEDRFHKYWKVWRSEQGVNPLAAK